MRPAPLTGVRVLVTRPAPEAWEIAERLRGLGVEPIVVPIIQFRPPPDPARALHALRSIQDQDWVLFTSARGVEATLRLDPQIVPRLSKARVAVVGPGTRQAAQHQGLEVAFVPSVFHTEALASELPVTPGDRVVLLRAQESNPALPGILGQRGATVEDVPVYSTVASPGPPEAAGGVRPDWILFTSPSTVHGLAASIGGERLADWRASCRVASIGPVTTRAAQAEGFRVDAEADPHTVAGLLHALQEAYSRA